MLLIWCIKHPWHTLIVVIVFSIIGAITMPYYKDAQLPAHMQCQNQMYLLPGMTLSQDKANEYLWCIADLKKRGYK